MITETYRAVVRRLPALGRFSGAALGLVAAPILAAKHLRVPPTFSFIEKMIVAFSRRDPDVIAVLRAVVRPGMAVVDVGANVGDYSRALSHLVGPEGHVYAIEPDPDTFAYLAHNTVRCGNVSCHNLALADRTGQVELFIHPESCSSNSLFDLSGAARKTVVQGTTLDNFVRDNRFDRVDIVKIDVEGGEALVLEGMKDLLGGGSPLAMVVEFFPLHLDKANVDGAEMVRGLRRRGFAVYSIENAGALAPVASEDYLVRDYRARNRCGNLLCVRGLEFMGSIASGTVAR